MKLRLFFILLFVTSVLVSVLYSFRFIGQNPHVSDRFDTRFVLLVVLSICLQMLAHIIRAYKSRFLLDHIRESKTSTLFKGLSIGLLFNSLLPMRFGEFIRAFYVGDALAISKTAVFMSIVIERLVDGVILGLSFVAAGILISPYSGSASLIMEHLGFGILMLSVILGLLVSLVRSQNKIFLSIVGRTTSLFNTKLSNRLRFMSWSGIYGTRLMLSNKLSLVKYFWASIIVWIISFISTAMIVLAFFDPIIFHKLFFIIQSSYAGVSTPTGPGYIGTFSEIVSSLLKKISVSGSDSFSIFIWTILTIPISVVGLFFLIKQRFNYRRESPHQDALINKLYRDRDISAEFGHFLDAYFKGEEINLVLTQAELDGKFKLVKSFKGGSNAQTMLVWQNQELVVKKITLPQFADKLKAQAEWLNDRSELPHLPKVISSEDSDNYYFFDLAFKEDFFPFFDFIHSHSTKTSYEVLGKMLRFMDRSIYVPVPATNGKDNLFNYIETKVLGKANDTAAVNNSVSQLILSSKITINGTKYDNLLQIIDKIKNNAKAMEELADYYESPIHGDLTIDNLIASDGGDFLVIDPNNENQVSSPVVDYGKLYQSLHSGYEFLIQLDNCHHTDTKIDFEDAISQKYAELYQLIDNKLKKDLEPKDYRSILFHEAVHYCRMLTYRANINPDTLPVFYATAVKLFNEFLEQYAK